MRPISILTKPLVLITLQLIISTWFLFDFFVARDSFSARALWKHKQADQEHLKQIHLLSKEIKAKFCQGIREEQETFDKIVLIVIDALGSEFIPSLESNHNYDGYKTYQKSMPYVQSLLDKGEAIGFIAKAATPTVTMPRIKALLSGTIPSFVDVIYNLARDVSKFEDDNILSIARSRNKSLVFYGDDTWLSLFDRSIFKRVKETLSLFASDYTSVDTNVTLEAIPETQLEIIDWDFLILHYLGLDHIGHVFGSNQAPLIKDKLLEMDSIIENISKNMASKQHKTLIVVCGDHGMSEEGNHGGDTNLESHTAMLFHPIGLKSIDSGSAPKQHSQLQQIDLSVTLAFLTNLPIPDMSKGVIIEPLLQHLWSNNKSLLSCASFENMIQLAMLIESQTEELLALRSILDRHINNSSKSFMDSSDDHINMARKLQSRLLREIASRSNPLLLIITVSIITGLLLVALKKESLKLLMPLEGKVLKWINLSAYLIPVFMLGSTDYIESEHLFWPMYSLSVLLIFVIAAITIRGKSLKDLDNLKVGLFVITYLLTVLWNNQKLCRDVSTFSNSFLPILSLIILFNSTRLKSDIKRFNGIISFFVCVVVIYTTKHFEEAQEYNEAEKVIYRAVIQRLAILSIIVFTVVNIFSSTTKSGQPTTSTLCKIASGWMCVTFLISRKRMYMFLISNVIMEASLNSIANSLNMSLITRAILYINFAQSAFYNQGNSNLFTTIDVNPAFFGQTIYNFLIAVPLVAISTFSVQIYWYIKMLQKIEEVKSNQIDELSGQRISSRAAVGAVGYLVILRNFVSFNYYLYVCLVLRNHLFLWSVISPKLIYHYTSNLVLTIALVVAMRLNLFSQKQLDTDESAIVDGDEKLKLKV